MYVCLVTLLNRVVELNLLRDALARERRQFLVVYGRRRCGKSTLLRQLDPATTSYSLAVEGEPALQRQLLARQLSERFPGFALATYPTWDALLRSLSARTQSRFTLVLDEFPYLVRAAPELASTLQALLDDRERVPFDLIVCGSSQQMMEDAVLAASAPLYGRADGIVKVEPLAIGYLPEAFAVGSPAEAIEEYAVWGGVPRYWELRERYGSLEEAVRSLLLTSTGLLRDEPRRLLRDDLSHLSSPISLLAVIADGSHRVSEIGGRLGKTSADLTRPLSRLVQLGYLRKEIPFEESTRNSKRTLYTVADPFVRFYYRYILPEASRIEAGRGGEVWADVAGSFPGYVGQTWEELCRRAVRAGLLGSEFDRCERWWGTTRAREKVEIDGVARSRDGRRLLLLECKWSSGVDVEREIARLRSVAPALPFYKGEEVVVAVGMRADGVAAEPNAVITPELALRGLR